MPPLPRLSKSKLVAALQCDRRLWLAVNRPDLEQVDAQTQAIFATGHRVGEVARALAAAEHGGGEYLGLEHPSGWAGGLARCRAALAEPGLKVLFEAPFAADGLAVVADIVVRQASGELWLIEVKSSTGIEGKPYLDDAAFQAWALAQAGHEPQRVVIRLIDNTFVYPGGGDYRGLLRDEDVTDAVRERLPHVARHLQLCRELAAGDEPPIRTGRHCHKPYDCGYLAHCQRWEAATYGAPPDHPVGLLGGRHTGRLTPEERARIAREGWVDLRQLPAGFPADARARAIVRATRSGRPWIDPGLAPALRALPYPRYHFDFETIAHAVPRWRGTRPYQQVPFQWSCHVEHAEGHIEHHAFLDLSGDDPREACAARLVELLDTGQGVVLTYHQPFEQGRLADLARDLPHHAPALWRIIGRLDDLLPLVRRHYYHPAQQGRWSLKAVLPAVVPELDYSSLDEVQHGAAAQLAYLEAIDPDTGAERREHLRERLLAYCQLDTWAMVELVRRLSG
jgi:hypothetical protein